MFETGGLRLGVVLFNHEEGKRRLELLAEWRRGVRDPLGIGALGGHFAARLFPAVRSNMRPQPDRFVWVPAIVEYACERTLSEAGSVAGAKAAVHDAIEELERRAWDAIADASENERYRFRPRSTSYTWFASLPHHAYLPTLRRMGLIRHSTVPRLLSSLIDADDDDEVGGEVQDVAPRAADFRRAVDRRKQWLAATLRRRRRVRYPKLTSAEKGALRETLAWYGSAPGQQSLLSWCIARGTSVEDALADWKGSKTLHRRSPQLGAVVRAAGEFRRCAAIVEGWLEPRLTERGISKRIPKCPRGFDAELRQLKRSLAALREHLSAQEADRGRNEPPQDEAEGSSAEALQRSFESLKAVATAADRGWSAAQEHLASDVLARKGTRRRYRNQEPQWDEEEAEQDDWRRGLNSWLANEIAKGLR